MAQQRPNTDHLPEVTPPWLLDLLQKYGEDEGILDGAPPTDGVTEDDVLLSSLKWDLQEDIPSPEDETSTAESTSQGKRDVAPVDTDWLADLRAATSPTTSSPETINDIRASDRPDADPPDWMQGLETEDAAISDTRAHDFWGPEFERTPLGDDGLSDDDTLLSSGAPDVSSTDEGVPDWFAELQAEAEAEVTTPPLDLTDSDDGGDDWMASLSPDMPQDDVSTISHEADNMVLPDWMQELEADSTSPMPLVDEPISDDPPSTSFDLSDFLFANETAETEDTLSPESMFASEDSLPTVEESFVSDDTPDWFAELQAEAEADVTSPSLDLSPSSDRDADDSMASLSPDMPSDDVPPTEETGLPDWMQEFDTNTSASDMTSNASETTDEADWLSELQPDTAANDATTTFDSSLEDTPDWLQDLEADVPLAEEGTLVAESNQFDWPDEMFPPETSTESLDITDSLSWLDNLSEDFETNIDLTKETSDPSLISDDVPDWLNTLYQTQPVTEAEDISNKPVVSDNLPSWLDNLDETKPVPEADDSMDWLFQLDVDDRAGPDDRSEDLIAAIGDEDSPLTWLDDRPTEEASIPLFSSTIDTTSPFEADVRAEKQPREADTTPASELTTAGLAAAVAGVGAGLTMPKDIQAGTQIDKDKDVAREFYDIATGTNEPSLLTKTETSPAGLPRLLRISLNLIFVLLLAFPLFVHRTYQGYLLPWLLPDIRQQQLIRDEMQEAIITKPPNSVALVSFDYTPGTAGEMNPLALAVINQLLGQGLRMIAISLEPTGQAEAQKVLQKLDAERYQLGEHFLNLGYLPGGPVAIRNLTQNQPFAQLIEVQSGKSYASYEKWPAFQSIAEISLIVEISATPESARWWAEQLYPATQQPMVAVVSAAAEPFVRPYRASNQYEALIVGTNGAAALEIARIQQHTIGSATAMLDSQSVVHLIIMILMLLGTVAGLIENMDKKSKSDQNIDDLPPVSTEQSPSTPSLTKIQAQTEQTVAQGLQADINKIRQRQAPQIDEAIKTEQSRLLKQFLPIADNLARALDYPQQDKDTLLEGVALVQRQLIHVFETEGVRPIETHNQPFDPQLHEAIATVPANTISDDLTLTNSHLGIIVEEVESGYQHDDKLLRPARVVVAT